MQSRQIYDVIIFVHQTEIRPFLSAVHVGPEVSAVQCGVASNNDSPLLWLAFYSPPHCTAVPHLSLCL